MKAVLCLAGIILTGLSLLPARAQLAAGLRGRPTTDPAVDVFNRTWVPELIQRGLTSDRAEAFQAVAALAMTPSSSGESGLMQISRQAPDPKVREKALKALEASR